MTVPFIKFTFAWDGRTLGRVAAEVAESASSLKPGQEKSVSGWWGWILANRIY